MTGAPPRLREIPLSVARRLKSRVRGAVKQTLRRFPSFTADIMLETAILERFYRDDVGKPYGINRAAKMELVRKFQRGTAEVPSGTSWLYHVVLATEVLSIPPHVKGDVVECGAWKGASTASLSNVCAAVGRTLVVCDSFQGLPTDGQREAHQYPHVGVFGYYAKGMYAGALDEVKAAIAQHGRPEVCRFVAGFYSESLTALKDPIAFAFLDVDLASSMKDCLRYIWPLLVDGGHIYTDDSCDMTVVKVWFDEPWWQETCGCAAPGYVGSGCGLPLSPSYSSLGYARKLKSPEQHYRRMDWFVYPDENSDAKAGP